MLETLARPCECYALWHSYGYDPTLFATLSRLSAAMFLWEPGFEKKEPQGDYYLGNISIYEAVKADIAHLLQLPPMEFVARLPETPSIKAIYGTIEAVKSVAYLRALQHRKHYRGIVNESGKVIFMKFQSDLTQAEDIFLEAELHKILNIL